MVGTAVLSPLSPYLDQAHYKRTFHNEFFAADADALLANSNNYFARWPKLSRSVAALANYLATQATIADVLLRQVLYSTTSDTRDKHEAYVRRIMPKFALGYRCLLFVKLKKSQRRGPCMTIFKYSVAHT